MKTQNLLKNKLRIYGFLSVILLTLVLTFQNCSEVEFAQKQTDTETPFLTPSLPEPETDKPVVICDPFSPMPDDICDGGISGKIYYLSEALRSQHGSEGVNTYLEYGIQVPVNLVLKQLAVPTRSFLSGFPTSDGKRIADEGGEVLVEYFGMDLRTILRLNSDPQEGDVQSPGFYQLAILSDDGAIVDIVTPSGDLVEELISIDGNHPTRMGCASSALFMDLSSAIPLRIRYYQGPREHIALKVLWRPVDSPGAPLDDLCGESGNHLFYGPNYNDYSESFGFGQLASRGWRTPGAINYVKIENR